MITIDSTTTDYDIIAVTTTRTHHLPEATSPYLVTATTYAVRGFDALGAVPYADYTSLTRRPTSYRISQLTQTAFTDEPSAVTDTSDDYELLDEHYAHLYDAIRDALALASR